MKKQLTLTLMMLLVAASSFAVEVEIGGLLYEVISKTKEAKVIQYKNNEYSGEIVVPSTIEYNGDNYSVTSIDNYAFRNCSGLTSVTIPNSVTSIGDQVFAECRRLTDIIIPNSVMSIGYEVFMNCNGLTSLTIPNSVTSIGFGALFGCSGVISIVVEDDNTVYDSRNNCNAIIKKADNTLIAGCKNTVVPNEVTSIGMEAFAGCSGLPSVTIPTSVTSIEDGAFFECSGLTSVTIHNCITRIGNFAFRGCTGLTDVSIPNSVTSIGTGAFYSCSGLTSVTIGNGVTSIGAGAFEKCSGLTSITIGSGVTFIGNQSFLGCDKLLMVNSNIMEPFSCPNLFPYNTYRKGTLNVPAGTKDLYIRFDGWREFLNIEEVGGEAEQSVWLSLKDAQGATKIKIKKGTKQELMISPEEGWKILSVTMDGTDVTGQVTNGGSFTTPVINSDATIIIVYEEAMPTRGATVTRSQADVKVVSDGVIISNAEPDTHCVIYSTDGQQVVNTIVGEGTRKIVLQQGQVYILTIEGRTLKFAL